MPLDRARVMTMARIMLGSIAHLNPTGAEAIAAADSIVKTGARMSVEQILREAYGDSPAMLAMFGLKPLERAS